MEAFIERQSERNRRALKREQRLEINKKNRAFKARQYREQAQEAMQQIREALA